MKQTDFFSTVEELVAKDPRYAKEAYVFVREALDHTHQMLDKGTERRKSRDVSGQELLTGIKDYALSQYGPMSFTLLEEWGIRACEDFGEIVFNLVDAGVLSKTERDNRSDFQGGYDFYEAFAAPFKPVSKATPSEPPKIPEI